MKIRSFTPEDTLQIKEIFDRYFADKFDLPDFMQFICAFVIEDERGILTAGGIRDIAECIAVTNMERHPKDRIRALYQLLNASTFVCKHNDYDQMYVWSQDAKYTRRLQRNGFRIPPGNSLILDL